MKKYWPSNNTEEVSEIKKNCASILKLEIEKRNLNVTKDIDDKIKELKHIPMTPQRCEFQTLPSDLLQEPEEITQIFCNTFLLTNVLL